MDGESRNNIHTHSRYTWGRVNSEQASGAHSSVERRASCTGRSTSDSRFVLNVADLRFRGRFTHASLGPLVADSGNGSLAPPRASRMTPATVRRLLFLGRLYFPSDETPRPSALRSLPDGQSRVIVWWLFSHRQFQLASYLPIHLSSF